MVARRNESSTGAWLRGLAAAIAAALILTGARQVLAEPASSGGPFPTPAGVALSEQERRLELREERRRRREYGVYLALAAEFSRVRFYAADDGHYADAMTSTLFRSAGMRTRDAWGPRFEGGFAFGNGRGLAFVPHLSLSLARLTPFEMSTEVLGIEHRWRAYPWWWSAAVGAELQVASRILGLSAELGIGGVAEHASALSPEALSIQGTGDSGPLAQVSMRLRLPTQGAWRGGVCGTATAYMGTELGSRLSLGVFLDWDGGRK